MSFLENWDTHSDEIRYEFYHTMHDEAIKRKYKLLPKRLMDKIMGVNVYTLYSHYRLEKKNGEINYITPMGDGKCVLTCRGIGGNSLNNLRYFPQYKVVSDYPFSYWIMDMSDVLFDEYCMKCMNSCFILGTKECDFFIGGELDG